MRAGGGVGVAGGGSSAGRFHRRSRQCAVTKSSSRDALQLICSDELLLEVAHVGMVVTELVLDARHLDGVRGLESGPGPWLAMVGLG